MATKEVIEGLLKDNPQGLTIEEMSSKLRLNRATVSSYLKELKGEKKIIIRAVGQAKLHYWKFKEAE